MELENINAMVKAKVYQFALKLTRYAITLDTVRPTWLGLGDLTLPEMKNTIAVLQILPRLQLRVACSIHTQNDKPFYSIVKPPYKMVD